MTNEKQVDKVWDLLEVAFGKRDERGILEGLDILRGLVSKKDYEFTVEVVTTEFVEELGDAIDRLNVSSLGIDSVDGDITEERGVLCLINNARVEGGGSLSLAENYANLIVKQLKLKGMFEPQVEVSFEETDEGDERGSFGVGVATCTLCFNNLAKATKY